MSATDSVRDILAKGPIFRADGSETTAEELFGAAKAGTTDFEAGERVIGIYMSASYCPPCRQFTPMLATVYKKIQDEHKGRSFEVVFVSWDEEEEDMAEYYKKMPWTRLRFQDERAALLTEKFEAETIPTFITIRASDGAVLNRYARAAVPKDMEATQYPWVDPENQAKL